MRLALVVGLLLPVAAVAGDGPKPRMLKGEPLVGMAAIDGRVLPVVAYDDGTWVDPEDLYEVEAATLLSDPAVKPVRVSGGWFQPIRAAYRGAEGWQALKWGMTRAEVRKAMSGNAVAKPAFAGAITYGWKLDGEPASVSCVFVGDRLAGVSLHAGGAAFDRVQSLLEAKLGEPTRRGIARATWESGESIVTVSMRRLAPVVLYASRAFGPLLSEQLKEADKTQADREL